jgi:hypothetical protein
MKVISKMSDTKLVLKGPSHNIWIVIATVTVIRSENFKKWLSHKNFILMGGIDASHKNFILMEGIDAVDKQVSSSHSILNCPFFSIMFSIMRWFSKKSIARYQPIVLSFPRLQNCDK